MVTENQAAIQGLFMQFFFSIEGAWAGVLEPAEDGGEMPLKELRHKLQNVHRVRLL